MDKKKPVVSALAVIATLALSVLALRGGSPAPVTATKPTTVSSAGTCIVAPDHSTEDSKQPQTPAWTRNQDDFTRRALARIKQLRLPGLRGRVPTYYSPGYRHHAEKLQGEIEDMKAFYQQRLGVRANVILAVLGSRDWTLVAEKSSPPYGLPFSDGNPPVIFMPATGGGVALSLMKAREKAIPQNKLQAFLKNNHTTFNAMAHQFVDIIGFHELGHILTRNYGIDPKNLWLNELLASYWDYAYISEKQPEDKRVFDLLARPSATRPKNTSLGDFERLYSKVDDYGWYQGMFESRIKQIYPQSGLKFLICLKRVFPLSSGLRYTFPPLSSRMKPQRLLERLEKISPGFMKWAAGFGPS